MYVNEREVILIPLCKTMHSALHETSVKPSVEGTQLWGWEERAVA